ncbi:DUF2520 domain-containing protein [Legionella lytica]|uniref:DUF2520 domain-containing protein n=1 Tax=Legionella lytica TaxID=96232 RepID=A0ABY4Y873_9GAMM|nr:Rossmann-like and DUF2520 domain-containing protein [Legionella lytica]USQ13667.1 DUF2520 domain-containing protein [Legionella lytica]
MRCNIIGAGRLGKNIARALNSAQIISSLTVCNRSLDSAQQACEDIGVGLAIPQLKQLPEAEITWLCCNDDVIPQVVADLLREANLKPGSFVIHSSGVLNSSLLAPLKQLGCSVASFHPLKAFKMGYVDAAAFYQVDCVLEGDAAVCDWLKTSFSQLGAYVSNMLPENKAVYHAAACIASNYLVTLVAYSEELLLNAGLPSEQARRMLINLAQGNINNLQQVTAVNEALTGPLARGDINTITLHLDALENPQLRQLYQAAGQATLALTGLNAEQKEQIGALLVE